MSTKNVKIDISNKLAEYIKQFVTGGKVDLNIAVRMANRSGILINDINLTRLLETSYKTKESFKLLVDSHTFQNPDDNAGILG